METILGGLAFACLIAAQFFAIVAVHNATISERSAQA